MLIERTFAMIKPNAMKKNVIGKILARYEQKNLKIIGARITQLTRQQAELFYEEHKSRPFFNDLVAFIVSGPVMLLCLEGPQAIALNREIMGATDPAKAEPGTLRKEFGDNIESNAIHGSDSPTSAAREIGFFFRQLELYY